MRKILDRIYDYFDQVPMFGYFSMVVVVFAIIIGLTAMGL